MMVESNGTDQEWTNPTELTDGMNGWNGTETERNGTQQNRTVKESSNRTNGTNQDNE